MAMPRGKQTFTLADKTQFHRHRKYFTYIAVFPNGAEWVRQEPMVHDLEWHLKQMAKEHEKDWDWRHHLNTLFQKQEVNWRDKMGIRHILKIESQKRNTTWGQAIKSMGSSKHGLILPPSYNK
jgi:hypothetical protein